MPLSARIAAAGLCVVLTAPALAQGAQSCALTLEGRWIDEASSNIKGKTNQVTGFTLRRQGDGYYMVTLYDYGAKAMARGVFKGSTTSLTSDRVMGFDDLSLMFSGTVVGPLAINSLADMKIRLKRTYTLSADGSAVAVAGDTLSASISPDGTLAGYKTQPLAYKSLRARYPRPCERERRAAGWDAFKAAANAWRDSKDKPPLADAVRQHAILGLDEVNSKNFDAALDDFEAGLDIDPLWPSGHYNAAIIYAQELDFEDAAWHMRAYLELTPADDKEFQANRDRMLLWQGKLMRQQEEQPQSDE